VNDLETSFGPMENPLEMTMMDIGNQKLLKSRRSIEQFIYDQNQFQDNKKQKIDQVIQQREREEKAYIQ
jgi:hypothetical protein